MSPEPVGPQRAGVSESPVLPTFGRRQPRRFVELHRVHEARTCRWRNHGRAKRKAPARVDKPLIARIVSFLLKPASLALAKAVEK